MIRDFYRNKAILITGTTGFIGKVVLEKLMTSCPEIRKFYLLVRPKKDTKPMERVTKEILSSQCFSNCKKLPHWEEMINSKIHPIEGDITMEGLGFKPSDRELLINDLDVVINIAASVNFTERLCDALNINYHGSLRMMQLATECKHLAVFTHVSTCYVNSNIKGGFIKEEVYEWKEDHEQLIKNIEQMTKEQQDENLLKILGEFPNTYTFTKSMAERMLKKRRPANLPMCIIRPAIVGSSFRDPLPGWTDTFSAGGAIIIAAGLGVISQFPVDYESVLDFVPCDFVSHHIIVGTALQANKPGLTVAHASAGMVNPFCIKLLADHGIEYIRYQPFDKQIQTPVIRQWSKKHMNEKAFYYTRELPIKLFDRFSKIPGISTSSIRKQSKMQMFLLQKIKEFHTLFGHFTEYEWKFECRQTYEFIKKLDEEERKIFIMDPKEINWRDQIQNYLFGVQTYMFSQDAYRPDHEKTPILIKNKFDYFEDFRYAFFGRPYQITNFESIKKETLKSSIIETCINNEIKQKSSGKKQEDEKKHKDFKKKAEAYFNEIEAYRRPIVARSTLFFFIKTWRQIFDQIIVNENQLRKIHKLMNEKKDNYILVPTHKSYMDFILLGFVHYHFSVDAPFLCGDEVLFNLGIASYLMKSTTGFKISSEKMKDKLYKTVIEAYIFSLLDHGQLIELFLEKRRSRTGKISKPTEDLFNEIIKVYFNNKSKSISIGQRDLKFVPITINYDRVLEGDAFPLELLGEEPQYETLYKLVKKLTYVTKNFGRVNIKYGEPLSIQQYADKYLPKNQPCDPKETEHLINNFGIELSHQLQENQIIMSTSLIAAVLLMYRKGVSNDLILKRFQWIYDEIQARGGEMNLQQKPTAHFVSQSLEYLSDYVEKKKDIVELAVNAKNGQSNILMLSYYRNNLIHFFIQEAYISIALFGLSTKQDLQQGVSTNQVHQKVFLLSQLFQEEFLIRDSIDNKESFKHVLTLMHGRNFITYDQEKELVIMDTKNDHQQLSSYFLNNLVLPYLECYWVAFSFFIEKENKNQLHEEESLYNRIQWLIQTLHELGLVRFYEACMLQSIKNAIKVFEQSGVLKKEIVVKKKTVEVFYKLEEKYKLESVVREFYDNLVFFMPQQELIEFEKIQGEFRKLTISEIPVLSKL